MKSNGKQLLGRLVDNFLSFVKDRQPKASIAAAIVATPIAAAAVVAGAQFIIGIANRDPDAIATGYFNLTNPDTSKWLAGLKGQLPDSHANHFYQLSTLSAFSAAATATITHVVTKFATLRSEAQHLARENHLLKEQVANTASGQGSLSSQLNKGLQRVHERLEERDSVKREAVQATRVRPGPGLQ
ncbi:hypothetical protein [Pseudomonas sp. EMN2]|uniref:hypothetical protein n=1 Tax=Pseudomonas sp. EMN2 TaxID=2615212 RepID=UPI00129A9B99|nr:hypothetical protein [Pseudomonas sp. EMN2]